MNRLHYLTCKTLKSSESYKHSNAGCKYAGKGCPYEQHSADSIGNPASELISLRAYKAIHSQPNTLVPESTTSAAHCSPAGTTTWAVYTTMQQVLLMPGVSTDK